VRRPEGDVKDLRAVGRRARRSVDAAAANRLARFLSNFPSRRPSGALYGPRGDGRLHARVLALKYRPHRATPLRSFAVFSPMSAYSAEL